MQRNLDAKFLRRLCGFGSPGVSLSNFSLIRKIQNCFASLWIELSEIIFNFSN